METVTRRRRLRRPPMRAHVAGRRGRRSSKMAARPPRAVGPGGSQRRRVKPPPGRGLEEQLPPLAAARAVFAAATAGCHAARLGRTSLPRGVIMLTEASLSIWGWGSLGIVLFLITFGPFVIFYLAFYILCFVGGGLVVTLLFGKTNSEKYLEQCEHSFLPPTSTGVPKEILARGILLPLINQLSDPDYINQYVIWMIRDSNCSYEAFMNIIKLSDNVGELEAVRDKAAEELQYLRSLDTAGDDINTIKNQINSLLFVKKVCDSRIQRLQSGKEINTVKLAANFGKLCTVPLDSILVDNVALQFFMDYMQQTGGQAHLFFWMTVEGYRVTAQQQLEVLLSRQRDGKHQTNQTKGLLRAAAVGIYEQYLSEKASPRVTVDDYLVAKLADTLNHEDPTPEIFDDIQRKVYELMLRDERFYPSFRQNALYVRMLAELDMLKDPSFRGSDDGDGESFNGSPTGSINLSLDDLSSMSSDDSTQLHAYISDTGVCNDHGKTYALYAITVHRRSLNSEEMWKTYRRYSDFHDFHMRITEQFENLSSILKLPGKKTFNNMDRDFLEKRKKDLNAYLQMDTFVNPLRNSMRNVSNAVKSLPDSLAEGMTKMSDNMGRMSERLGQDIKQSFFKVPPLIPKADSDAEHCRVSAQLDDNVDDNIPLRVMLLLMDEVFDLKERNQWLRRNIKNLLQQLIRATYGDTINRKIVDHVDWMTSPEQVADSVKRFRDAFWPNGILAETVPCRDKAIRMRTRVAGKTKLLAIMPDELKHIIGAETTRKGILRVFEMFQHNQLNRRMVYVFLEGFLETLFPQYKFRELFNKLHSRSKQMQKYKQKLQTPQAPSLQRR
uniref:Sorting nexin 13 n=1 Tax=Oryctolagus cuniculus TaxID=9986 RepID=A0A5F9DDU5_RABIT